MISQFVSPYQHRLLGDLNYDFPQGTHAIGRLDYESEGLLILTTDKSLTRRLLHPDQKHERKYVVMVKGIVSQGTANALSDGLDIQVKGRGLYQTQSCQVERIHEPSGLALREDPPHGFSAYSWLEFTLREGKNRQIRKMCSSVHHPCRRLIRTSIEKLSLGNMVPGEVREMDQKTIFDLLLLV